MAQLPFRFAPTAKGLLRAQQESAKLKALGARRAPLTAVGTGGQGLAHKRQLAPALMNRNYIYHKSAPNPAWPPAVGGKEHGLC